MLRDVLTSFIKLHVLYHASQELVFGLDLIQEPRRHGYELSPGTLYPMLHVLEDEGYLRHEDRLVNGATTILLYLVYNLVYGRVSHPSGRLSDRIGRESFVRRHTLQAAGV